MSVHVVLITHGHIGDAMVETARATLSTLPLPICVITVGQDVDPGVIAEQIKTKIQAMGASDGVLVLTDLYGSTPCNIATQLHCGGPMRILAGVNLPMLLRVMNYPELSLDALCDKAICGAKNGIRYADTHDNDSK